MTSPSIDLFAPSDYNEVVDLWKRSGLILTLSDTRPELLQFYQENPESFFLLKDGDAIIGSVIGSFDGRRGYIHHLAVDPAYHGNGYGKLLMDEVEQYFRDREVVKIHLMVEKSNQDVVGFYENRGWYIRDDLILMSKSLRDEAFEL